MPIEFKNSLTAYEVGRRVKSEEWNGQTLTKEGASALGFGVPVMPGAAAGSCVELDATNSRHILGITEATATLPRPGDAYAQYDNVPVAEIAVLGVLLGANVTRGAQARWNTVAKNWTGAAQSATVVTIPGAQFDEAGVSGAVGVIRYRRPVPSLSISG